VVLGITGEDETDVSMAFAVGDRDGRLYALVGLPDSIRDFRDQDVWFAGWAADQRAYDPGITEGPAPSLAPGLTPDPMDQLPTIEAMLAGLGDGSEPIGVAEDGPSPVSPREPYWNSLHRTDLVALASVCVGGGLIQVDLTSEDFLQTYFTTTLTCDGQVVQAGLGDPPGIVFPDGVHEAAVRVTAPDDVTFRVVPAHLEVIVPVATLPEPVLDEDEDFGTRFLEIAGTSDDGAINRQAAIPRGTDSYIFRIACTGAGTLDIEVDGIREPYRCWDTISEYVPAFDAQADVTITASGGLRFIARLYAFDRQALSSAFLPPNATLTGLDPSGAEKTANGFHGCGLSYEPASGTGGFSDACGASWQPTPRILRVGADASVRLQLHGGWVIESLVGEIAPHDQIVPSGRSPSAQRWLELQPGRSQVSFDAPDPGDWGIRLYLRGEKDGATFSRPYYFRIVVEG
jgi:hypothetical protein